MHLHFLPVKPLVTIAAFVLVLFSCKGKNPETTASVDPKVERLKLQPGFGRSACLGLPRMRMAPGFP